MSSQNNENVTPSALQEGVDDNRLNQLLDVSTERQVTEIINAAMNRKPLHLNDKELKKIAGYDKLRGSIKGLIEGLHLGPKDDTFFISNTIFEELSKNRTMGSKIREAVGLKNDKISRKMLEQISGRIKKKYEELVNEEPERRRKKLEKSLQKTLDAGESARKEMLESEAAREGQSHVTLDLKEPATKKVTFKEGAEFIVEGGPTITTNIKTQHRSIKKANESQEPDGKMDAAVLNAAEQDIPRAVAPENPHSGDVSTPPVQPMTQVSPQPQAPVNIENSTTQTSANIDLLHAKIREHPDALKISQILSEQEENKKNVSTMQGLAAKVRDDCSNLKDAVEFIPLLNNIWTVPGQMTDQTFNGPIFMSRFKDNKVVLEKENKPIYDILWYEKGKLIHEKSLIAPDGIPEGSKASVDDNTRKKYLEAHAAEVLRLKALAELAPQPAQSNASRKVPPPIKPKPVITRDVELQKKAIDAAQGLTTNGKEVVTPPKKPLTLDDYTNSPQTKLRSTPHNLWER